MDFEGTFLLESDLLSDEVITPTATVNYEPINIKYDYSQHTNNPKKSGSLLTTSDSSSFLSLTSPFSSASSNLQLSFDSPSTFDFSPSNIEELTPSLSPSSIQEQTTNIKKPNHGGRKRSIIFEQEEAEFQRKEFLERNRIAASKCRQKKKKWMKDLETNYEKLSTQNQQLRSMVLLYQEEINSLKTELLSHNGLCSCADMRNYIQQNISTRKMLMQDYDSLSILSKRSLTTPQSFIGSPLPNNNSFLVNHALPPPPLPPYLKE